MLPGGASKKGFETNQEDIQIEWFRKVVVGPSLDAFEDVLGTRAGGEHQDRRIELGFAKGADDGEAVGAGQHTVEDDGGDVLFGSEKIGEGCVSIGLVMGTVA